MLASISALESEGIVNSTEPFTEFSSTESRKLVKPRVHVAIDGREFSAPGKIVRFQPPLMQEACTSPLTPVTSSEPLISLISSSRALRGTVSVYSTLAGLLCDPQLKLWSWSGYLVRIETMVLARIDFDARLVQPLLRVGILHGIHLDFIPVPGGDVNRAIDVVEFHAAVGSERVGLMEFFGECAA